MFTADNFRRIFDLENRKGNDLTKTVLKELEPETFAVREKKEEIKRFDACNKPYSTSTKERRLVLESELASLKAKRNKSIDDKLAIVSENILNNRFKIQINSRVNRQGKTIYSIDDSPESFFLVKQLQLNINLVYKVKPADRHSLAMRVRDTINTQFPLKLVRTDIASFYESINQEELLRKLEKDQLLSPSSKSYIRQILSHSKNSAGISSGLPRGIGISAYLAEIWLRSIDEQIKSLPGNVLYCRYVDDIVAVFAQPPIGAFPKSYRNAIEAILKTESFAANPKKTVELTLPVSKSCPKELEYLGFRFFLSCEEETMETGDTKKVFECKITPSTAKLQKYKDRLDAAFKHYCQTKSKNQKRAFRDLTLRLKFLTGNTKLLNNKSSVSTGVYYNNSIVNCLDSFQELDLYLQSKLILVASQSLRGKLSQLTFTDGFSDRRFHKFKARELQRIVQVWKDA